MDLFAWNQTYRIWVCKTCEHGVPPRGISGHLGSKNHRDHITARTGKQRAAAAQEAWSVDPWDPHVEPFRPPPPDSLPLPELPVYMGWGCLEDGCDSYAVRTPQSMRQHRYRDHGIRCRLGRPDPSKPSQQPALRPVSCQRFFPTGRGSSYFIVTPTVQVQRARHVLEMSEAEFVQTQVADALQRSDRLTRADEEVAPTHSDPTEYSPWLELTRWPEYVRGHAFRDLAMLAALPDPTAEPILQAVEQSVQRLVQAAFDSITSYRINEFDQVKINSFLQRQGVWDRPIHIRLRPKTYRRYQQIWVRLISFVIRTSRPNQAIDLKHQPTTRQLEAVDRIDQFAQQLLGLEIENGLESLDAVESPAQELGPSSGPKGTRKSSPAQRAMAQLDRACLDLSIALLDHELRGDLFESPLIGFMATIGVDVPNQTYRDPSSYTGHLSGLVKISQMLVAQRAVQLADDGEVEHPGDALDRMRERFLMFGVHAPFGWITRLRAYGKKIQNTTTSIGYINWNDDHDALSYRELHLTMDGLRRFVRVEVELAQYDLERLFLLSEDDEREGVVPELPLHRLADDPVNNKRGWNFLQDPRNQAILPTTGQQWLLQRVLMSESLRKEFTEVQRSDSSVIWRPHAVKEYLKLVDRFLQRLLLLVFMTGGQPPRGTELLALRHRNTPEGRHRNIFIEHGLVSTVTAYSKSQRVTNTTKLIHRYLPQAVSELLVYYLWLILPFTEAVTMLSQGKDRMNQSPFLWPYDKGHWDPARLGIILKQEAAAQLQTRINVLSWRHVAIGISRMHLKCGGFKRDYGVEDQVVDQQAGHGS
ncbi:hypothetical protein N7510_011822 [Penicillium lagena]|uniref:uncharacterized protein n=1 Tax=Penicillium lagena TaxID=94218 RepID=UPI002541AC5D|nr:uncharacterized protein N7510_011822 [Penicillium lagena]KAJ5602288.1 hypothetical protein N7510_011822 [Penicillium lagena]